MQIPVTQALIDKLRYAGVESLYAPGAWTIPMDTVLEPPCSLKWMAADYSLRLGAFSYAVSGYFFGVTIGRYTSIGEQVQVGRGNHPTSWLTTSPCLYLNEPVFSVGNGFPAWPAFQAFRPTYPPDEPPTVFRPTVIGNDVWIGHGAFIRQGVTIGDGAVVAAQAVVVKNVPPYALVAGNPAVVKKFRFSERVVERLLQIRWWRLAPWQLDGINIARPIEALGRLDELTANKMPYQPPMVQLEWLMQD